MTLLEEARELIKRYLSQNPGLSTASMARACRMSASTARSIIQGEVKKTAVENITSLLLTFMEPDDVVQLLQKHASPIERSGVIVPFAAKYKTNSTQVRVDSEEGFSWQNPDHLIYAMAHLPDGVEMEWIIRKFGEYSGKKRVEAMLNEGIVREVNGRIKIPKDMIYLSSMRDVKNSACMHLDNWKESDMKEGGWLYFLIQNYSDDDHEEARTLTREFLEKLAELGKRSPNGDKVLMLTLAASLLGKGKE